MPVFKEVVCGTIDKEDENKSHCGGKESDSEKCGVFSLIVVSDEAVAETGVAGGAEEEITGNRTNGGKGSGDFDPGEEVGNGKRDAEEKDFLKCSGIVDLKEIEEVFIGGGKPEDGIGDHGEEADEKGDKNNLKEGILDQQTDDRDEYDDRRHLDREDVGVEGGLDPLVGGEEHGNAESPSDSCGKPEKSGEKGGEAGVEHFRSFFPHGEEDAVRWWKGKRVEPADTKPEIPERQEGGTGKEG